MTEVPIHITLLFWMTVLGTILWFYVASKSKKVLLLLIVWTIFQSIMGASGFYQDTSWIPPKIMLFGVFPCLLAILLTFLTRKGRALIDKINLKTLTYLHSIRIPMEIVLLLLYYEGLVSVLMTFEGTNFDILSGISAPIVAYIAFKSSGTKKKLLIWWNVICLLLLLNVVITAVFAFPSPFQKLAFDQPNIAILNYPFNLLPSVVVPMVIFSHLAAIRKLTGSK